MPDFMGLVARARIRTADEDWAAAAELWATVTAANPVNGDYWARLGEARFGAHDYAGARQAYEKVLRLGVRETFLAEDGPPLMPGEVAYRIACCEAAEFDRAAAELDAAIPGLTDAQILVGMMKMVRYLDDGHARVTWPEKDENMSRMLPVDMFMFTEGLYVIGAAPGGERLLGAQVEKMAASPSTRPWPRWIRSCPGTTRAGSR